MDKRVISNFSETLNTQVNDLFEKIEINKRKTKRRIDRQLGRYSKKIEVITGAANKSYTNIKKESLICWKKFGRVVKRIAKNS